MNLKESPLNQAYSTVLSEFYNNRRSNDTIKLTPEIECSFRVNGHMPIMAYFKYTFEATEYIFQLLPNPTHKGIEWSIQGRKNLFQDLTIFPTSGYISEMCSRTVIENYNPLSNPEFSKIFHEIMISVYIYLISIRVIKPVISSESNWRWLNDKIKEYETSKIPTGKSISGRD